MSRLCLTVLVLRGSSLIGCSAITALMSVLVVVSYSILTGGRLSGFMGEDMLVVICGGGGLRWQREVGGMGWSVGNFPHCQRISLKFA